MDKPLNEQLREFEERPLTKVTLKYGDKTIGEICERLVEAEAQLTAARLWREKAEGLLKQSQEDLASGRIAIVELIAHHSKNWSEETTQLWNQRYDELDKLDREIIAFLTPPTPTPKTQKEQG